MATTNQEWAERQAKALVRADRTFGDEWAIEVGWLEVPGSTPRRETAIFAAAIGNGLAFGPGDMAR